MEVLQRTIKQLKEDKNRLRNGQKQQSDQLKDQKDFYVDQTEKYSR